MQLEEHELREFASLYQEEFDEPLSLEEARLAASRLLRLYQRLAQPFPGEESSKEVNVKTPE